MTFFNCKSFLALLLLASNLFAAQGSVPPTTETIDALNEQGFTAVPASGDDPAIVNGVPLYIGEPGPEDDLGQYTGMAGDNSDPRITLFTPNFGDPNNPEIRAPLWAQLFNIITHELFHYLQREYWKDEGEAEMEACPPPPDPGCVEDFRDRIDCHNEGDAPCGEVQAYNHSFWALCAKAKLEEDRQRKNQLLRQAMSACIKGRTFIAGCVLRVLICGGLPNPENPPSMAPPADCECPE